MVEEKKLKLLLKAMGHHSPNTVLMAEGGDFLPNTITIHHNGRGIVYIQEKDN